MYLSIVFNVGTEPARPIKYSQIHYLSIHSLTGYTHRIEWANERLKCFGLPNIMIVKITNEILFKRMRTRREQGNWMVCKSNLQLRELVDQDVGAQDCDIWKWTFSSQQDSNPLCSSLNASRCFGNYFHQAWKQRVYLKIFNIVYLYQESFIIWH